MSKQDDLFDEFERRSKEGIVYGPRPHRPLPENIRVLSPEELRERMENELKGRISPELLTHFSKQEALELVRYFEQTPTSTTQEYNSGRYDLIGKWNVNDEARAFLTKEIHGREVIELGDNGKGINEGFFKELGAVSYKSADAKYCAEDGLTYLMKQPEGSAIIVSFGVLEDGVLYNNVPNLKKYTALLGREIYRVTPKAAITFHGLDTDYDLISAGFNNDEGSPKCLNTFLNDKTGGFRVLRK